MGESGRQEAGRGSMNYLTQVSQNSRGRSHFTQALWSPLQGCYIYIFLKLADTTINSVDKKVWLFKSVLG